ncbi:MAG: peptidylprolyl isomerase [Pirellulales bacterium]
MLATMAWAALCCCAEMDLLPSWARAVSVARAQGNPYPRGYETAPMGSYGASLPGADPTQGVGSSGYGPTSPTPPTAPTRPASWPGGAPQQAVAPTVSAVSPEASVDPPHAKDPTEPPFEPAAILARVGSDVVQAADILPTVHQYLEPHLKKLGPEFDQMPEDVKKEQIGRWRREVVDKVLSDAINIKLVMAEIRRVAPEEGVKKNLDHFRELFNESEIKRLKEIYKATSVTDLDNKLRAQGGSLESQRLVFCERYMAQGWMFQQLKDEKDPSHEQMTNYYRDHMADWERPARARWEQLTAKYSEFPSKDAARAAIASWGNAVLNGAPLAEVAKAHSHGLSAEEGGLNDWTTHGSLRSEAIDRAIFGLPVGALSQIIEEEDGYHIVRVVEREDKHLVPFSEVQPEIKKKLQAGDRNEKLNEYLVSLRQRIPVHNTLETSLANRPTGTTR